MENRGAVQAFMPDTTIPLVLTIFSLACKPDIPINPVPTMFLLAEPVVN